MFGRKLTKFELELWLQASEYLGGGEMNKFDPDFERLEGLLKEFENPDFVKKRFVLMLLSKSQIKGLFKTPYIGDEQIINNLKK